ncbi:MAG: YigZ family protein [Bacilli bacterium]|nr:YigZ family protein [Bacilli bacterium]
MFNMIEKNLITEQTINKSRFITSLFLVSNTSEALDALKQIRKTYYDATHNCYAYIIGNNQEIIKYSDDKEPSQTAGIVIYEVLKKNNLSNILCVVTRYFGGIKLGSGGLIRAYSSSTAKALEVASIIPIINKQKLTISCSYEVYNLIQNHLKDFELLNSSFSDLVKLEYLIPESSFISLIDCLNNITKGAITLRY